MVGEPLADQYFDGNHTPMQRVGAETPTEKYSGRHCGALLILR